MDNNLLLLTATAASIGLLHTVLGPDHYLPFIAIAKARNWTVHRTLTITFLCGLGHILSSVLLGLVGAALGIAVGTLEWIESFRGDIAAWLLIGFGLVYFLWGVRKAYRNKSHSHIHVHKDGKLHQHDHSHHNEHLHIHEDEKKTSITPWILFVIFLFGPCEPLIPLLMYPAAQHSFGGMILVAAVFGIVTIATMLILVRGFLLGFTFIRVERFTKFSHAMAGAIILICGISIVFLGL